MRQKLTGKPLKDSMGKWRTRSLFVETNQAKCKIMEPIFTLYEEDLDDYWSMHKLYLEYADVSEYRFAKEIIGSWRNWQKLLKCAWFKPHIESWREEVQAKIASEAVKDVRRISEGTSNSAFTAAKWLAEGQYKEGHRPNKAGRPRKNTKVEEKEDRRTKHSAVGRDFERLKLVSND